MLLNPVLPFPVPQVASPPGPVLDEAAALETTEALDGCEAGRVQPAWGGSAEPPLYGWPRVSAEAAPRKLASLWNAEFVPPPEPPRRRIAMRWWLGAGMAVAAVAASALLLPRVLATQPAVAAIYNAPMMVLRASRAGRVVTVAVAPGEAVDPGTTLLTIHTDPPPDPEAAGKRARLDTARARLAALDDALAQPAPSTEAGRTRVADLAVQRGAAAAERAAAQDDLDRNAPKPGLEIPVLAGVHGVVRSLETQPGTDTQAGAPLVRLMDCDRAFLTVAPAADLRSGQAVQVRMPNLPPATATVRPSSGIAEPPDSLVIPLPAGALGGACPAGMAGTVTPGG